MLDRRSAPMACRPGDPTFHERTVCMTLQTQKHRTRSLRLKAARRLLRRKPPRTGPQTLAKMQQRRSQKQRGSSLQLRRNLPQMREASPPAVQ